MLSSCRACFSYQIFQPWDIALERVQFYSSEKHNNFPELDNMSVNWKLVSAYTLDSLHFG